VLEETDGEPDNPDSPTKRH